MNQRPLRSERRALPGCATLQEMARHNGVGHYSIALTLWFGNLRPHCRNCDHMRFRAAPHGDLAREQTLCWIMCPWVLPTSTAVAASMTRRCVRSDSYASSISAKAAVPTMAQHRDPSVSNSPSYSNNAQCCRIFVPYFAAHQMHTSGVQLGRQTALFRQGTTIRRSIRRPRAS